MIEQIVEYNKKFVENKGYEPYLTSKYPNKKLAVLTCMDTRLTELLPAALGLKNGDAKIIKNAGGVITHPYGSVVRSLLVAILELGVEQVMVIGHTDCGVQGMDGSELHGGSQPQRAETRPVARTAQTDHRPGCRTALCRIPGRGTPLHRRHSTRTDGRIHADRARIQ